MLASIKSSPTTSNVGRGPQPFVLLTGTAPGSPGVGGVILKDLVHIAGEKNCECCWLAGRHERTTPHMEELSTTVIPRRYETAYRPVRGIAGELISAAALRLLRPSMIQKASIAVERSIRESQARFLLAVLDSPAVIQVALAVHRRTRIPLRVIVWDDVDLFCRQGMLDRWTRRWVERSFSQTLQASERTAVICENMQEAYKREHGVDSIVLRHGVAAAAEDDDDDSRSKRDYDIIGFAGSVTAPDCMQSLVNALDRQNWRLNGRNIVLRLVGARYLLDSLRPQRIEYFGWRSVSETRALLAECDLLYLPQSFRDDLRRFSQLSFPTKLSTYVAAHRPIFLHAPDYASLSGFWGDHDLGPSCSDLSEPGILSALGQALGNESPTMRWLQAIGRVHGETLGPAQFEDRVCQLID